MKYSLNVLKYHQGELNDTQIDVLPLHNIQTKKYIKNGYIEQTHFKYQILTNKC